MKTLLRLFVTTTFCLALTAPILAGPNEGGTLILHAVPVISRGDQDFCDEYALVNCEDALVTLPGSASTGLWFIAAAFRSGSSPRVSGISFGIDYDPSTVFVTDSQLCGPDFELTDSDWPAPGTGTAVTWESAQTEELLLFYFIAGYEYYGRDVQFCLTPHPAQGGNFADDSIPAVLDPIADYGCLGFNSEAGYLPCPAAVDLAACCLPNGTCEMQTEDECVADGGNWLGLGSVCEPNPCATPTRRTSWGEIKGDFR